MTILWLKYNFFLKRQKFDVLYINMYVPENLPQFIEDQGGLGEKQKQNKTKNTKHK